LWFAHSPPPLPPPPRCRATALARSSLAAWRSAARSAWLHGTLTRASAAVALGPCLRAWHAWAVSERLVTASHVAVAVAQRRRTHAAMAWKAWRALVAGRRKKAAAQLAAQVWQQRTAPRLALARWRAAWALSCRDRQAAAWRAGGLAGRALRAWAWYIRRVRAEKARVRAAYLLANKFLVRRALAAVRVWREGIRDHARRTHALSAMALALERAAKRHAVARWRGALKALARARSLANLAAGQPTSIARITYAVPPPPPSLAPAAAAGGGSGGALQRGTSAKSLRWAGSAGGGGAPAAAAVGRQRSFRTLSTIPSVRTIDSRASLGLRV
jgi:hypothetical protein